MGRLAYRMLLECLSGGAGERAKHDTAYYEAAVTLQISNRLPDGAAAEEYDKRAIAFLEYIQPNLERPYSPEGVSNYLLDLMPMGMSDTAMLIKSQAKANGTYLQHFHLARACRDMMFGKQSARAPRPSPDFGKIANVVLDHTALATLAGMALPDGDAAFAGWADRKGSDGATLKMCDNCPHNDDCFCDPRHQGDQSTRRHPPQCRAAQRHRRQAQGQCT